MLLHLPRFGLGSSPRSIHHAVRANYVTLRYFMSSQMIQEETIAEGQKSAAQAMSAGSKLTMQVILRRDLLEVSRRDHCLRPEQLRIAHRLCRYVTKLGWPSGPLMAQAAHAATAVLIKHRNNENVKLYEEDIVNMRKVRLGRLNPHGANAEHEFLGHAGGTCGKHRRPK